MPLPAADPIVILAQVAAGFGLAACAGLRAFLPPLALGLAARTGWIELPPELAWLAGLPALTVLAAATVLEAAGDKIPVLDHLLDAAGSFLRPAAGAFVGAAPLLAWILPGLESGEGREAGWALLALGAGGGALVGLGVHAGKATLRLFGSALTGGVANPLLSLAEDLAALLGVVLSLLLPLMALAALAAAGVLVWRAGRRAPRGAHSR